VSRQKTTLALISLYDFENNAVRQLAANLRHRGFEVVEIYFKDWVNNHLHYPSDRELQQLVRLVRESGARLVGLSLRASAYQRVTQLVCSYLRDTVQVPLVLGGWHATVRPEACMPFVDALCLGEADASFPIFVARFFDGDGDLEACLESPGFWVRGRDGEVRRNPPLPLVEDLDALPWRDYDSPQKWVIDRSQFRQGDPMARDPLHQVMCSIGCVQKCSFCHNSFEGGAPGPSLRVRSVDSVLAEIKARRETNPAIRRVRFDDEIFGLNRKWLAEFARRYPQEVGLPFDILSEPTVVSETYADLLQRAGARVVHLGIQSTGVVNREKLQRRATPTATQTAIERLTGRGMRLRYLVMVDIPGVTGREKAQLLEFLQQLPRPYDLYLFSLTHFPGTKMVEDQLQAGELLPAQVEGVATKTFDQYRVDLGWPRDPADTWWLSLMIIEASGTVPRAVVRWLARQGPQAERSTPLVYAAHLATLSKTVRVAARMAADGELTPTLVRRWWNPKRLITM